MKIKIAGGGPAGLYFACLAKKFDPRCEVDVYERNPPDATYGFGVVLAEGGLKHLQQIDSESYERIVAEMQMLSDQLLEHPEGSVIIDSTVQAGAIARLKLLEVLQQCCIERGVRLHFHREIASLDELRDADLIVASDGVNSRIRAHHAREFGTDAWHLKNRYAWYGVEQPYDKSALVFRRVGNGVLVAHYYRYSETMSTFVVECDESTWFESGLADMNDEQRRLYSERAFADHLHGQPLIANHSMWRQFAVVSNQRCVYNNIVLLGDAQRSVHFSIGSGTRLALEDGARLYTSVAENDGDIARSLAHFEQNRSLAVEPLVAAARHSYEWYERFRDKLQLAPLDFAYDFMTRTGRMSDRRLGQRHPRFLERFQQYKSTGVDRQEGTT